MLLIQRFGITLVVQITIYIDLLLRINQVVHVILIAKTVIKYLWNVLYLIMLF